MVELVTSLKDRAPPSAACAKTCQTPTRSIRFVCAYQIKTLSLPSMFVLHAVLLSAPPSCGRCVLWPPCWHTTHLCRHRWKALWEPAATSNLHGCIFHCVWLFRVSGFGFGRGQMGQENKPCAGGRFPRKRAHPKNGKCGNSKPPKKWKKGTEKRKKKGKCGKNGKKRKFWKGAQNHQICLFFQCLGAGGHGERTRHRWKNNCVETMRKLQRGGARARVAPHWTVLSSCKIGIAAFSPLNTVVCTEAWSPSKFLAIVLDCFAARPFAVRVRNGLNWGLLPPYPAQFGGVTLWWTLGVSADSKIVESLRCWLKPPWLARVLDRILWTPDLQKPFFTSCGNRSLSYSWILVSRGQCPGPWGC